MSGRLIVAALLAIVRQHKGQCSATPFPGGEALSAWMFPAREKAKSQASFPQAHRVDYGQPGPFAPGVEGRVFDAVHALMKKVGGDSAHFTPFTR
jgi:hypothetical protein